MLKTAVSYLRKEKICDDMYMAIDKPCGADDCDNIKAMAESVVFYWDNIATKYRSSKGCLLPGNYISDILIRCSKSVPKVSGRRYVHVSTTIEMGIYFGTLLVELLVVLGLSYHLSVEHAISRYAVTLLPKARHIVDFFRIANNKSVVKETYTGLNHFFGTETISRENNILQNITTYLTRRVQPQMYHSRHTIFGGVISAILMITFVFYITSSLLSKLRKHDELQAIATKKFQTFKHAQRLFECLQKVSNSACDGQDCAIYKNEIFSNDDVLEALSFVKKDMQELTADEARNTV